MATRSDLTVVLNNQIVGPTDATKLIVGNDSVEGYISIQRARILFKYKELI
jgi:hypothetical protein